MLVAKVHKSCGVCRKVMKIDASMLRRLVCQRCVCVIMCVFKDLSYVSSIGVANGQHEGG